MKRIGVLGGMGPAATVDFLGKVVALTPARCDQDHLPLVVANLPQIPDRSSHIMGAGPDPLPFMLQGINLLNRVRVGLVVVPCNTSHHWFDALQMASAAPMLHIAGVCAEEASLRTSGPIMVLATRGTLVSGFHQRALRAVGLVPLVPEDGLQRLVDRCIADVKGGRLSSGVEALGMAIDETCALGARAAIMACTEIPIAAQALPSMGMTLIDSTHELARATVRFAMDAGWHIGSTPRPRRHVRQDPEPIPGT